VATKLKKAGCDADADGYRAPSTGAKCVVEGNQRRPPRDRSKKIEGTI